MIRKTFIVAATLVTTLAANADAKDVKPGFDPASALPSVSLPQTAQQLQVQPSVRKPSPEVSTAVTRNGTTKTTTDLKSAPVGALQAAAASTTAVRNSAERSTNGETRYKAGVTLYGKARAYDGHTLTVDGNPVRLNGIEAPGLRQVCSTPTRTSWRCGQKAFERLAALVGSGKVRCTVAAPAGHGAAATCSAAQTKDIGALLVSEGLALPNRQSAGIYNSAAVSAMTARRGLWIGPFTDPAKWRLENR
ncbi:thermonuclease family protein [Rhizobium laguerreae]|uniref:thermonuclease family protein n=1 Tax=Rhizobium laguerreae TaxID=1076926 RepID=UPI001C913735|nr:thermonuclease family protein [Rhizobium laguerreae]MBY3155560.1 thermonuclease family protein [Rhizobium laguerreae]